jgi:hypothetical protein
LVDQSDHQSESKLDRRSVDLLEWMLVHRLVDQKVEWGSWWVAPLVDQWVVLLVDWSALQLARLSVCWLVHQWVGLTAESENLRVDQWVHQLGLLLVAQWAHQLEYSMAEWESLWVDCLVDLMGHRSECSWVRQLGLLLVAQWARQLEHLTVE